VGNGNPGFLASWLPEHQAVPPLLVILKPRTTTFMDNPISKWVLITATGVGGLAILSHASKLVRKHVFIPKFTVLDDLLDLGTTRKGKKFEGQAVVCGGRYIV